MTKTEQKLFSFIKKIKAKYNKKKHTNYKYLKVDEDENFVFKPLEIEGANGFIVYSTCKIDKNNWFKYDNQKIKQMKNGRSDNPTLADLGDKEDFACRYYYYEKLHNKGEHVTIVMINPAFAYSKKLDPTINNIRNNILNEKILKVGSFDIVNISPIRTPYTDALAELEKSELYKKKEYVEFLKSVFKNSAKIILAWGNSIDNVSDKSNICKLFNDKKIKNKLYAINLTQKGYPMHLCSRNNRRLKDNAFGVEMEKDSFKIKNL